MFSAKLDSICSVFVVYSCMHLTSLFHIVPFSHLLFSEAKGLDFDEICIVDFFCSSSTQMSKAWKELLRRIVSSNSRNTQMNLQDKYPELESKAQLLSSFL